MITLNNIYKSYDSEKTYVLNNISLKIEKKDFIAIIGESGVGKSTLLNIIAGIDTFEKGTYTFKNNNIEKYKSEKLAKFRNEEIGFVFQNYNLIPYLSVERNIELPLIFSKKKNTDNKKRINEVLELLGLEKLEQNKTSNLSGGEQQRVAFARAIVNKPSIILADEPTGNLDEMNTERIFNILKQLNEDKYTIIVVTHDKIFANRFNKIYKLDNDKIEKIK